MCLFVYFTNYYEALFTSIPGDERILSSVIYDISCK